MRKPAFCICENKDADQLCGNCPSSLCPTWSENPEQFSWSETPKKIFLVKLLILLVLSFHSSKYLDLIIYDYYLGQIAKS